MIEAFLQGLGDSVGSCIPLQFGAGGTEKKKTSRQGLQKLAHAPY